MDCRFSFEQGVDNRGKATTKVHGGTIQVTLSQLPPQLVIDWALDSRKYMDGAIIVVDAENIPLEKTFFKNGACVEFELDYTQKGETYVVTKIVIQSEILIVGDGIDLGISVASVFYWEIGAIYMYGDVSIQWSKEQKEQILQIEDMNASPWTKVALRNTLLFNPTGPCP